MGSCVLLIFCRGGLTCIFLMVCVFFAGLEEEMVDHEVAVKWLEYCGLSSSVSEGMIGWRQDAIWMLQLGFKSLGASSQCY